MLLFNQISATVLQKMYPFVNRVSRVVASSVGSLSGSSSCSLPLTKRCLTCFSRPMDLQKLSEVRGDFMKWGSLGSCRNSSFASGFTPLKPKPLGSIIDIRRAELQSPEDLADIWDDFHLGRGHIGASMKASLYHLFKQRVADCRYFVMPLRKGSGYTTMFTQVQIPHMIFTGLEDYKARGTEATPYFTVSYYTEFAETKDLVLIRGDIVFASKLTDAEAKWLLETTQSFYLNDNRYKLIERFNKQTRDFEFKDVLQALDIPSL